jgi:glutamate-1-semialdehyde 2,1-aminomutase
MSEIAEISNHANDLTSALVSEVEEEYVARNPKSQTHIVEASKVLPGGSTRTALHFDPFPLVLCEAEGSTVTDLDGHRHIDLMNDLTAGLYGHSNAGIKNAINDALSRGMSLGAVNTYEIDLAREICRRFQSIELVRFCNSGSEANLIAMQVARQMTGRPKTLVFSGGYHGSFMSYLNAQQSLNVGMDDIVRADFNDIASVQKLFDIYPGAISAIIVEPMIGSGGGILAAPEFLQDLAQLARQNDTLLILDEVQSARFGSGGLQEVFGVSPDITTLGKFLGGGASFGALGGRREIMKRLDASQPGAFGHGGTFNNNVITMAAGSFAYKNLATDDALHELNALGDYARLCIEKVGLDTGVPIITGGYGSIISIHFQHAEISRSSDVETPADLRKFLHLGLLNKGYYCARRGTINLSLENTKLEVNQFAMALGSLCDRISLLFQKS